MELKTLTIDQLPVEVYHLREEVKEIKALLLQKSRPEELDLWFDLNQFCEYHPDKPSKPTVYGWVNAGIVPVHKGGKKLRFLKSEIDNWLKHGKKKTYTETEAEAESYVKRKGGNNGR